jgi:hypothetical protein
VSRAMNYSEGTKIKAVSRALVGMTHKCVSHQVARLGNMFYLASLGRIEISTGKGKSKECLLDFRAAFQEHPQFCGGMILWAPKVLLHMRRGEGSCWDTGGASGISLPHVQNGRFDWERDGDKVRNLTEIFGRAVSDRLALDLGWRSLAAGVVGSCLGHNKRFLLMAGKESTHYPMATLATHLKNVTIATTGSYREPAMADVFASPAHQSYITGKSCRTWSCALHRYSHRNAATLETRKNYEKNSSKGKMVYVPPVEIREGRLVSTAESLYVPQFWSY